MPATKTYKTRVLVLRKTKLGERDVIATMLGQSGALVKAVAKGARKPGGALAGRIELFSMLDCMLARGRSLDVVADARAAEGNVGGNLDLEQAACASAIAELACNVAHEDLEQPRLFDVVRAAFEHLAGSDPETALAVCAACLLKVPAIVGYRPSLDACVSCGQDVRSEPSDGRLRVSFEEGGVVCASCAPHANCIIVDPHVIEWTRFCLYSTFPEIAEVRIDRHTCFEILHFARQWARAHTGRDVKSLDFIFTSGLWS